MLSTILASLNLTAEESAVYEHLVEHGPEQAGMLAKRLGFPRPSLYGYLRQLEKVGLVSRQEGKDAVQVFQAANPDTINLLLQEKVENLHHQQASFRRLLQNLKAKRASSFEDVRFQSFKEVAGLKHVLQASLLYPKTQQQAFLPVRSLLDHLSAAFWQDFSQQRVNAGIDLDLLVPETETVNTVLYPYFGSDSEWRQTIATTPDSLPSALGYFIYGNTVAYLCAGKGDTCFWIESAEAADLARAQHHLLRNASMPLLRGK